MCVCVWGGGGNGLSRYLVLMAHVGPREHHVYGKQSF